MTVVEKIARALMAQNLKVENLERGNLLAFLYGLKSSENLCF